MQGSLQYVAHSLYVKSRPATFISSPTRARNDTENSRDPLDQIPASVCMVIQLEITPKPFNGGASTDYNTHNEPRTKKYPIPFLGSRPSRGRAVPLARTPPASQNVDSFVILCRRAVVESSPHVFLSHHTPSLRLAIDSIWL